MELMLPLCSSMWQGCLRPVEIRIPENSILWPSPEAAVVGGNVLTSQRVTDVILKCFEAAAASQVLCRASQLNISVWRRCLRTSKQDAATGTSMQQQLLLYHRVAPAKWQLATLSCDIVR